MADRTRLELATSGVTGRHSNRLNYRSTLRRIYYNHPMHNILSGSEALQTVKRWWVVLGSNQ